MRSVLTTVVCTAMLFAVGCSDTPEMLKGETEITGTVMMGGSPVKNVTLWLNPLGEGHPAKFNLGEDGKFTIKVIPGDFIVYFEKAPVTKELSAQKAAEAFKVIPVKYHDPKKENQVTIKSGEPATININ
ncbi:MAG: hypothetical protein R3B84_17635 [Zavarzinella sp.]